MDIKTEGFVEGRWYIYNGPPETREDWNETGLMDFVFEDRRPYLCKKSFGSTCAVFEDDPSPRGWDWEDGFEYWEEVPAPKLIPKEDIVGTRITFRKETKHV